MLWFTLNFKKNKLFSRKNLILAIYKHIFFLNTYFLFLTSLLHNDYYDRYYNKYSPY